MRWLDSLKKLDDFIGSLHEIQEKVLEFCPFSLQDFEDGGDLIVLAEKPEKDLLVWAGDAWLEGVSFGERFVGVFTTCFYGEEHWPLRPYAMEWRTWAGLLLTPTQDNKFSCKFVINSWD